MISLARPAPVAIPIPFCVASAHAARLLPGIALCGAVALAALATSRAETALAGRAWLEPLVLAILIGTALRTAWTPGAACHPGIQFSARTLLEIAVVLLGASVSAATVLATGPALLLGIAGMVVVAIVASYGIGRVLGLHHKMALLVACGNSICGNSAIAAVAPVIEADGDDVAASIAFTAVLGVLVVLALPLVATLLSLTPRQGGVLTGLTVYAVPQVLAAAAPLGILAVHTGTLVKLIRVLMLGPVVFALSLLSRRAGSQTTSHLRIGHMVPWFIVGFLLLIALRSSGLIPDAVRAPVATTANLLTIIAMAALGLSTDLRVVAAAGPRVSVAVTLSLLVLGGISLALIHVLQIA